MKLSEAKQNYVFKTRIELPEGDYVELREPNMKEFQDLSRINENEKDKYFAEMRKLFPVCVVDSSFENDNGNKATGQEVFSVLDASSSIMNEVLSVWFNSIPFTSRLEKKGK